MAIFNTVYGGEPLPYLCFTAKESSSSVKILKTWSPTSIWIEKSSDWLNWSVYTIWDTISLPNIWDKIYLRNSSNTVTWFTIDNNNAYTFFMTWKIAASWDVGYLLCKNSTDTISKSAFLGLFKTCTSLITPPRLPATTLSQSCYSDMFQWCSSLITAPELPALTIPDGAYYRMFRWCSSLTKAPKLPATTFTWTSNYTNMFYNCTSLETLPELPALSLTVQCYANMFYGCSKIKLSTTQTWEYQIPYRIPVSWTGTTATSALSNTFGNTWWTFTWTPDINTTYYTSNILA